jgi:nuclear transport factor 2 (NTF2) superfamily protein
VKERVVRASGKEVAVAVTSTTSLHVISLPAIFPAGWLHRGLLVLVALVAPAIGNPGQAATLPEERADALYHYYSGGGVDVQGPALLVRKNFSEKYSFSVNYYVDSITGASIDVVTNASAYTEDRTQIGIGFDYLYSDSLIRISYSQSDENDYEAKTLDVGLSHDFFGGMSTLAMGFSRGDDTVMRVDTMFEDTIDRFGYRVGWTQVLSPTFVAALNYEGVTEEGFLNNPYRSARVLGASVQERYPRTRSSNAIGFQSSKYWGDRSFVTRLDYRLYDDTWGVTANNIELVLSRHFSDRLDIGVSGRFYTQSGANFYSDNFDQEYLYMARDKELSNFNSVSIGGRVSFELFKDKGRFARGKLTLMFDRIHFSYDDYSDIVSGDLYEFDANVIQLFFSAWY